MNNDRSKSIGGSEIASVMGQSRWSTPLQVWAEKTGRVEPKDLSNIEAVEIGSELEEYVARKFVKKTGFKVKRDLRDFTHPDYPYMVGHIDRWMIGEDALLECKTCSAWKEKEWHGEDVPIEYVLQVNWYCGLLEKKYGYFAVLIGGQKFVWKRIEFDQSLFDKQVEAARRFWEEFVLKDIAPLAVAEDNDVLERLFPSMNDKTLKLEGEWSEKYNQLIEERAAGVQVIKDAEKDIDAISAQLKQVIGENEGFETDKYRVTWHLINRKEFTVKASSFRQLRSYQKKGE